MVPLTSSRRILRELADAVADGEDVDWEAASAELSARDARTAENLRAVQAVKARPLRLSPVRRRAARLRDFPWWLSALATLGTIQTALAIGSLALPSVWARTGGTTVLLVATSVTYVAAALFLLHGGASDRRALWLAAFLICVGSAPSMPATRWLADAGWLGRWLRAILPEALFPFFLFAFVRDFPRVVHLSDSTRFLTLGRRIAFAAGSVLFIGNVILRAWPGSFLGTPIGSLARTGAIYWPTILVLTLVALLLARFRTTESSGDEKSRASFLLRTVIFGCAPGFSLILIEYLVPSLRALNRQPVARFYSDLLIYLPLLAIPPGAVYAVRAHRVLDVRGDIHQALRRTIALRASRVLMLTALVLLCVHGFLNRGLPLDELLARSPAPLLLACAAIGGLFTFIRPQVITMLDRVVVGSDARATVTAFPRHVNSAQEPAEVLAVLAEHMDHGLATKGSVLLLHGPSSQGFVPIGAHGRPLPDDSALAALAATEHSPIVLDPTEAESLFRWLPRADQEWIADSNFSLLVPVAGSDGQIVGLAGVPPRASGTPYARRDHELATALTSSAALALQGCERLLAVTGPLAERDRPGAECSSCGLITAGEDRDCPACGERLAPAVIPIELNGRFRVENVLGRGGMGVVYRGFDLTLERRVALKTLPRSGAEALLRLRREAQSMARFVHPHLALIFGSESWRGVPILVVEYLAGGTLAARLDRPVPVRDVIGWGVALATALDAMHRKGLLHRDVKPSNIGFTEDGTPKLLDFGLARLTDEIGRDGTQRDAPAISDAFTTAYHVVGTPRYLSPEALDGAEPSPDQDLWALFVVMWEAIAGRHPFERGIEPGARRSWRMPDLLELRPDCPANVARILSSALVPRAERRLRTASDVRDCLAGVVSQCA